MKIAWISSGLAVALALGGCGSEKTPTGAPEQSVSSETAPSVEAEPAKIPATVAQVEEAWKCRGLMAAAHAAKPILKEDMPPELNDISADTAMFWTNRAAQLEAPDMTDEQENQAIVTGTRVLATRQAVEENLPDIRACLAAQKTL